MNAPRTDFGPLPTDDKGFGVLPPVPGRRPAEPRHGLSPAELAEYTALDKAASENPLMAIPSDVARELHSLLRAENRTLDGPERRLIERLTGQVSAADDRRVSATRIRTRLKLLTQDMSPAGRAEREYVEERVVQERADKLVKESIDSEWKNVQHPPDGGLGRMDLMNVRGMDRDEAVAEARRLLKEERALRAEQTAARARMLGEEIYDSPVAEYQALTSQLAELRKDPEVASHLDALEAKDQEGKVDAG